jgi:ribonucleoside-diphosphate reductase alpha chain
MQMFDSVMNVVSQGSQRRGSFAAYLDIDHPDIEEFLQIKDVGNPIQNLFFGVNFPDWWLNDMFYGKDIEKRKLWAKVLKSRQEKGLPYILFSDTINKNKPQIYKELNEWIHASNLCSEIGLPSNTQESFVCCLASMNLEQYDEWKDTDAVYWAILFLDAVMEDFIVKTENYKYLESAHNFAKRHRALGLGVMGYHSYLQKNMIPFESWEAKQFNAKVFKQLYIESRDASIELAELLGPAPIFNELSHKEDMEDVVTLMRNTTVLAIAPTTSSSSILGQVSPGIEPYSSNYFKAGLAKGNFMRTNKYLKKLLIEKDKDDEDTWRSIMLAHGSVQHLDFLSDNEKEVFKTFKEISPLEIIAQAAQRQQYIDQMQSLNLLIPSQMDIKDVNKLYLQAWESGVKSLYYQRSSSVSKEMMTKFVNCQSCES